MSTAKILQIKSTGSDETEKIAETIGRNLKGGEIIDLSSDLGGGKTTFVRGLARGAGSHDQVSSPTFAISKVYKTDKLEIHHFDFYRLENAGLATYELHDLIGDPGIVVVVEWSEIVKHVLPEERLDISIKRTGEDERELRLSYPGNFEYLVSSLENK